MSDGGMAATAWVVGGPSELQPGDEIVSRQLHGGTDKLWPGCNWFVGVGTGEHPIVGGECIQLRCRDGDPPWYELNLWKGQEYFDDTVFHIRRQAAETGPESVAI